jgi:hypothetical protein
MRETRSYGSVRGVAGDRHPYRDSHGGKRDTPHPLRSLRRSVAPGDLALAQLPQFEE